MVKIGLIAFTLMISISSRLLNPKHVLHESQFNLWLEEHNINISASGDYNYRMKVFSSNFEMIEKHNNSGSTYTLGLNKFAHLTFQEFASMYLNTSDFKPVEDGKNNYIHGGNNGMPNVNSKYVNWVQKDKVTPVENQRECGSCYAFASVGAVESYHAIYNDPSNKPPVLSKQHMVDCGRSKMYILNGCQGGNPEHAFKFLKSEGTILDKLYPYLGYRDTCHSDIEKFTYIRDYEIIRPGANNLLEAVEKRPVMIGFEMTPSLVFFRSGIYQTFAPCGFSKNHAVLVVGYNLEDEIPHYIIKNSYGTSWGDEGYFKVAIGKYDSTGMCLLANGEAYAPTIN